MGSKHRIADKRRIDQRSGHNLPYWVELVLQRRHHTEVAASTANRPRKIWMGVLASHNSSPVDGHHFCRYQVVTGSAALLHQATFAPSERQASNSHSWATG